MPQVERPNVPADWLYGSGIWDGDLSPVQMARHGRLFLSGRWEFRSLDTCSLYLNGTSYVIAVKQDQGT